MRLFQSSSLVSSNHRRLSKSRSGGRDASLTNTLRAIPLVLVGLFLLVAATSYNGMKVFDVEFKFNKQEHDITEEGSLNLIKRLSAEKISLEAEVTMLKKTNVKLKNENDGLKQIPKKWGEKGKSDIVSISHPDSDSNQRNKEEINTMKWKDWPAIAYEESGHALVTKGDSFFHHARQLYFNTENSDGKTLMDEFMVIYKNRPDKVNLCGIRIDHAMALYLAVKQIQPTLVVESGVNAGQSTYIIRAASSTAKIFAIDPEEKTICDQGDRWIDTSNLTTYLTGKKFVDILDIDWKGMIARKEVDPEKTLIFLDDHLLVFDRIMAMGKLGVRHVIVEDNYKVNEGATRHDKIGTPKQMFFGKDFVDKGKWLFNSISTYAEFPPIVPPIMAKENTSPRKKAGGFMVASDHNEDIVQPLLRPDLSEDDKKRYEEIVTTLGFEISLKDNESYMQIMNYNQICYLELLPAEDIMELV